MIYASISKYTRYVPPTVTYTNSKQGENIPPRFYVIFEHKLSSCSNHSIDKKFQFSLQFKLKVAASVFRNQWINMTS